MDTAAGGTCQSLRGLANELRAVEHAFLDLEERLRTRVIAADADWRESATNLIHYAALRAQDRRPLQTRLAEQGLSSLGRSEPHVLATLHRVRALLPEAQEADAGRHNAARSVPPFGNDILSRHADALFRPPRADRKVRIMVTMPSEAAEHPEFVRGLVQAGMDVMRINCAHDDAAAWEAMCRHLRYANAELGTHSRIQFDLPGPKLRTGPFEAGPPVLRWKPERDERGSVRAAARVRIVPAPDPSDSSAPEGPEGSGSPPTLCVHRAFFEQLAVGRDIELVDLRGRRRKLELASRDAHEAWAIAFQGAWVGPETELVLKTSGTREHRAHPEGLRPKPGRCALSVGETVRLVGPSLYGHEGTAFDIAQISCTLSAALPALRAGHRVWFDDGKIGGVVVEAHPDWSLVQLTDGPPKPVRIRADKGINLPDTLLDVPALSLEDLEALEVAVRRGDLVALSFTRTPNDVEALHAELDRRFADLGVLLKIETRTGFENLGEILLTAMQRPPFGVMIARGDLAVESGFARLAEVQEEMLCLCEAAHAPIVWATAVLETAARKGFPSRAEITDAAVGGRAECVMLNKGPFVPQAVRTLSDILARMESHQRKKTPLFRRLRSVGLGEDAP
jgi:pyruvate kinase